MSSNPSSGAESYKLQIKESAAKELVAWVSRVDETAVRNTQAVDIVLLRAHYPEAVPDVSESEKTEAFYLLSLDALVRMKLTSFRDKGRVHLRDLMHKRRLKRGPS